MKGKSTPASVCGRTSYLDASFSFSSLMCQYGVTAAAHLFVTQQLQLRPAPPAPRQLQVQPAAAPTDACGPGRHRPAPRHLQLRPSRRPPRHLQLRPALRGNRKTNHGGRQGKQTASDRNEPREAFPGVALPFFPYSVTRWCACDASLCLCTSDVPCLNSAGRTSTLSRCVSRYRTL